MTQKRSLLTILLVFLTLSVQAQLLWKVSGNGLAKDCYLFGTHHLIDRNLIPQFDKILNLCGQTDAMVGEMVLSQPGLQGKMLKGSMMKGKKIKDLVTTEEYELLDAEFKSLMGVGMSMLGSFKPMMLMTMHQLTLYLKSAGIKKQPVAVDELFQKQAKAKKQQLIGLETLQYQMDVLFNSISLERQAAILLYEVRHKDQMMAELSQLNDVYVSGDLEQMKKLDIEDESMTPDERKMFIDDRNLNWMNQLHVLFQEKSCFVAVGCLHLVGETGLINQCRLKGYVVEPVLFQ